MKAWQSPTSEGDGSALPGCVEDCGTPRCDVSVEADGTGWRLFNGLGIAPVAARATPPVPRTTAATAAALTVSLSVADLISERLCGAGCCRARWNAAAAACLPTSSPGRVGPAA